jgi:hypothetical protein
MAYISGDFSSVFRSCDACSRSISSPANALSKMDWIFDSIAGRCRLKPLSEPSNYLSVRDMSSGVYSKMKTVGTGSLNPMDRFNEVSSSNVALGEPVELG